MSPLSTAPPLSLPLHGSEQQSMLALLLEHIPAPVYLVGGFLRDHGLALPPGGDIDLSAARLDPERLLGIARANGWSGFVLAKHQGVLRIHKRVTAEDVPLSFDLSPLTQGGIVHDLAARDCTVNAMALEVRQVQGGCVHGRLIDPFQGQADLARRRLAAVELGNYQADPLRMLRMLRLAHTHRLELDAQVTAYIRRHRARLSSIHASRLQDELWKILLHPARTLSPVLAQAAATGLYPYAFPGSFKWDTESPQTLPRTFLEFMDRLHAMAVRETAVPASRWENLSMPSPWRERVAGFAEEELSAGKTRRQWWLPLGLAMRPLLSWEWHPASPARGLSAMQPNAFRRYAQSVQHAGQNAGTAQWERRHIHHTLDSAHNFLTWLDGPRADAATDLNLIRLYTRGTWTRGRPVLLDVMVLLDACLAGEPFRGSALALRFREACAVLARLLIRSEFAPPRPLVSGQEIQTWFNLPPGPKVGALMAALVDAEALGRIDSPTDARRVVRELL